MAFWRNIMEKLKGVITPNWATMEPVISSGAGMISPLAEDYGISPTPAPLMTPGTMPIVRTSPSPSPMPSSLLNPPSMSLGTLPRPTEIPGVRTASYAPAEYQKLVEQYFPPEAVENMLRIMFQESDYDPMRIGPAGELGLFQIYEPTFWGNEAIRQSLGYPDYKMMQLPEYNIPFAAQLFKNRGYQPWTTAQWLGLVP